MALFEIANWTPPQIHGCFRQSKRRMVREKKRIDKSHLIANYRMNIFWIDKIMRIDHKCVVFQFVSHMQSFHEQMFNLKWNRGKNSRQVPLRRKKVEKTFSLWLSSLSSEKSLQCLLCVRYNCTGSELISVSSDWKKKELTFMPFIS